MDYTTIIIFLALVIFGWMNIFSSSYSGGELFDFSMNLRAGKQLVWILVSMVLIFALLIIETHLFTFLAYFIYGFIIFLLIAVFVFGTAVHKSLSWFEVAGFRVQPAEFSKFATAIALSKFMGREKFSFNNLKDTLIAGAIVFLPMLLIVLQNDTGSAMVFSVFLLVFFREGLHPIFLILAFFFTLLFIASFYFASVWIFIAMTVLLFFALAYLMKKNSVFFELLTVGLFTFLAIMFVVVAGAFDFDLKWSIIIAGGVSVAYFFSKNVMLKYLLPILVTALYFGSIVFVLSVNYIFNNILSPHQQDRIEVFLGLLEDPKGVGYNVHQSKITIGSGGLWGKGFLKGTQTKFDFVPEQDTDFIFCTVGEEWGFVGSSVLLLLYVILLTRFVKIAERQRSRFSRVFAYSVASIFFFHFGINIAMTIGLAPVIGIPLPFISYGGSSLWSFTLLLFTLLRLDMSREDVIA